MAFLLNAIQLGEHIIKKENQKDVWDTIYPFHLLKESGDNFFLSKVEKIRERRLSLGALRTAASQYCKGKDYIIKIKKFYLDGEQDYIVYRNDRRKDAR